MNVFRVQSLLRFFRLRLLPASILALLGFAVAPTHASAQSDVQTTTVSISSAVQAAGIDRPGINLGGLTAYGPQQLFKSLNYGSGGTMPGFYWGSTFQCSSGTTTSWSNTITDANGYAANWWVGATFVAINAATGTSYGSGTITASTANTGGTGISFTLSPAISSACNPAQNDVLMVRLTGGTNLMTPNQFNGGICPSATWNTNDTSPASSNTQQSLQMPSGCVTSFAMDQVLRDATNPNPVLASQWAPSININGSYTATFKAKCAVLGCSIAYAVGRAGTVFVPLSTVTPVYSATAGAGWNTYSVPFTGSETGSQGSSIYYTLTCIGTCLIQDVDVIESSTLANNPTVFRDAVVYELQQLHPGSIRYMDGTQWCSDVADEIAATGNRRWCGASEYVNWLEGPPIGYDDFLALANLIGSDAWISVGVLNQASDWSTLVNWLSSSGWTSAFAASGHKIYLEVGNEAWNTGAPGTLFQGNGNAYGYTLGLNVAAARAASGYNGNVIQLVGDSWIAPYNGFSASGWLANIMQTAGCTLSSRSGCPDFVDDAPYTLNYLNSVGVDPAGSPFLDEWAEISNLDSVTSAPPAWQYAAGSMYLNQQYALSAYSIPTAVYEVNESTIAGVAATQSQMDQIDASVGNGLVLAEHMLLMQRDSQVTGPLHAFTLAGPFNGYNGSTSGVVMPLWGTTAMMATGPGQAPGSANVDRPANIALEVINNAIGSNNNLMSISQSGTPTFYYAGGELQGGNNTILANSAVPYVNCFAYADAAEANWTTICFNNNLTSSESVILTGAGAPTGSVTQTVFPNAGNLITDHNEASYVGPFSLSPAVTYPLSTSASGTSYTIPPASMIALTYTSGTTPTLPVTTVPTPTLPVTTVPTPTVPVPTVPPATVSQSGTWTKVAIEGETVFLPAGTTYRFGIGSSFLAQVTTTADESLYVYYSTFGGDPAPGVVKELDVEGSGAGVLVNGVPFLTPATLTGLTWTKVAIEGEMVFLPAGTTFRFGIGSSYLPPVTTIVDETLYVYYSTFGADPAPGVVKELDVGGNGAGVLVNGVPFVSTSF